MVANASLGEVVMHTNSSGESVVSLKNYQETVQLCYVPVHEERMYNDSSLIQREIKKNKEFFSVELL